MMQRRNQTLEFRQIHDGGHCKSGIIFLYDSVLNLFLREYIMRRISRIHYLNFRRIRSSVYTSRIVQKIFLKRYDVHHSKEDCKRAFAKTLILPYVKRTLQFFIYVFKAHSDQYEPAAVPAHRVFAHASPSYLRLFPMHCKQLAWPCVQAHMRAAPIRFLLHVPRRSLDNVLNYSLLGIDLRYAVQNFIHCTDFHPFKQLSSITAF